MKVQKTTKSVIVEHIDSIVFDIIDNGNNPQSIIARYNIATTTFLLESVVGIHTTTLSFDLSDFTVFNISQAICVRFNVCSKDIGDMIIDLKEMSKPTYK
ncbi:hypothetical protein fHeYen901_151 [Yersinia phage fHe-Yen9-01]|uniref:Uncharacterized protein n=1 Tax=Yersinia phage fHe-Yen9-01 TaxID=1965363 RepID=A0A1V0DXQ2_9CAUD|nr:hypothetical protein KNT60_gp150 [Yersinia phage fHe-Yen9-01]ARB05924.1 hypothetical protein fHeYen901_151 [Yersinia phage fHe-Yen9-01]